MITIEVLKELLISVEKGDLTTDEALKEAKIVEIRGEDYFIDTARKIRQGFDEVIYGRNKSVSQIVSIAEKYMENQLNFICTGVEPQKMAEVKRHLKECEFLEHANMIRKISTPFEPIEGSVAIVAAGTSDSVVAYEAKETLRSLGVNCETFIDVGVAGVHRLFHVRKKVSLCNVIIAIAGMEGALPSLIGGLFPQPVIAVPTSTGYGVSFNGITALFSMLNSCASGVTVVNIDNGFGAAMAAFRILKSSPKN